MSTNPEMSTEQEFGTKVAAVTEAAASAVEIAIEAGRAVAPLAKLALSLFK